MKLDFALEKRNSEEVSCRFIVFSFIVWSKVAIALLIHENDTFVTMKFDG